MLRVATLALVLFVTAAVWAEVVLDSGNYAAAWTWLVAAILFAGCK